MARTTASQHRSTTTGRAQELQAKRVTDRKKVTAKTDVPKTTLRPKPEPTSTVDQKRVRKATAAARIPAKAATTSKTVTKRKRIRQRPMKVEDLVPGPLPVDTQAPQQTAVPRKIRL